MPQQSAINPDHTFENFTVALGRYANPSDAIFLQRFFKTGKGQYGEGDVFLGVRVPNTRLVCKQFKQMPLSEVQKLFDSPIHEHRLAAVIILVSQFNHGDSNMQQTIFDFYMENVLNGRVNNWDIVDSSAPHIVGRWLLGKPHDVLFELADSSSLWQRRVAVLSTFSFIDNGQTKTFFALANKLLHDPHDLMHKAIGWGIREVGKRASRKEQLEFLDNYASEMPRTMLRYAIEHLSPEQRAHYLSLKTKVQNA